MFLLKRKSISFLALSLQYFAYRNLKCFPFNKIWQNYNLWVAGSGIFLSFFELSLCLELEDVQIFVKLSNLIDGG